MSEATRVTGACYVVNRGWLSLLEPRFTPAFEGKYHMMSSDIGVKGVLLLLFRTYPSLPVSL